MRVLVVGASGFVGRWLGDELRSAGHDLAGLPAGIDVLDAPAVEGAVAGARPAALDLGVDGKLDADECKFSTASIGF